MNHDNPQNLELRLCKPPVRVLVRASRIRGSNVLRAEEDILLRPNGRVIVKTGWILRPVWRGYIEEPGHAVHPDLLNAMRAIANTISDVQSGFAQRLGRDARFQLLFGKTMTEGQILEMRAKSRARLARDSGILSSLDDWLHALWEERETALAAVRAIYDGALALRADHGAWPTVKSVYERNLPDLACTPFDALADAVRAEMSASGPKPDTEDTRRMAEALSAEADALLGAQMAEDADVRLSRVESCLRRAPERRRIEALEHLAGAEVLLGSFREKCGRYLTTGPGRNAYHGTRWNLEIAKRGIERRNFPRALRRLQLGRSRLAALMDRAY